MFCSLGSRAQFFIRGRVVDSASGQPLGTVSIENMDRRNGVFSEANGEFRIEVKEGDYLYFTHVGYRPRSMRVFAPDSARTVLIRLGLKPVQLRDVTVYRGPTEYQKDSANRASIYQDVFEYQQTKSVMSPISTLHQKFSKKYKDLRKLQDQIVDMEQQKFIDTRYTPEVVQAQTKLPADSVPAFMALYPMAYDYARTASDLEIKMWIRYNYQDYLNRRKQGK